MDEIPAPGVVPVTDPRGRFLGQALASPRSEIRLRLLERTEVPIDRAWWRAHLTAALARREGIDASAYRIVHGEGDGLPSLVVDRYDRWVVAQLLSAGLETMRDDIVTAIVEVLAPEGVLLRNDVGVRKQEGLAEEIVLMHGTVPESIEIREGAGPLPRGALGGAEDRRLPRPARTPDAGGPADAPRRHGARLLRVSRVLRPAHGHPSGACGGARCEPRGAGARHRERRAQWTGQHRLGRGRRLRGAQGLGAGGTAVRHGGGGPAGVRQAPRRTRPGAPGLRRNQPPGDAAPGTRRRAAHRLLLPPRAPAASSCRCWPTPRPTAAAGSPWRRSSASRRTIPKSSRFPKRAT